MPQIVPIDTRQSILDDPSNGSKVQMYLPALDGSTVTACSSSSEISVQHENELYIKGSQFFSIASKLKRIRKGDKDEESERDSQLDSVSTSYIQSLLLLQKKWKNSDPYSSAYSWQDHWTKRRVSFDHRRSHFPNQPGPWDCSDRRRARQNWLPFLLVISMLNQDKFK